MILPAIVTNRGFAIFRRDVNLDETRLAVRL